HVRGTRQSCWFREPAALLLVRFAGHLLMRARIRIFSTHAPICSRIYLPAQRELGATNFGLAWRRGRYFFGQWTTQAGTNSGNAASAQPRRQNGMTDTRF